MCSQICHNTKGSFKCSCLDNYVLDPDGRKCRATGMCKKQLGLKTLSVLIFPNLDHPCSCLVRYLFDNYLPQESCFCVFLEFGYFFMLQSVLLTTFYFSPVQNSSRHCGSKLFTSIFFSFEVFFHITKRYVLLTMAIISSRPSSFIDLQQPQKYSANKDRRL